MRWDPGGIGSPADKGSGVKRPSSAEGRPRSILTSFGNCSAHYEVPAPVRGGLDLSFAWLPEAVGHFGPGAEASVHVYPLEGQSLDTHKEISTASSVRAGGGAVHTQADVIDSNRLPPGKYVLAARVSGSRRGWDCHGFFVQVAE